MRNSLLIIIFTLLALPCAAQETTKYFIDRQGVYLGGFSGSVPAGGIEIQAPPKDGRDTWNGREWVPFVSHDPDVPGFFAALGDAIVAGQLPPDVYLFSLILKDQKDLAKQQQMLVGLAANPAYTKEQKKTLDALVKKHNLQLPEVGKE